MKLTLALIVVSAISMGSALANEPPTTPPPDAQFDTGRLTFDTGSIYYNSGRVSFPTGQVRFETGRIAQASISGREMRFDLTADVLFDFDRADLRPQAEGVLQDMLGQIRQRIPQARVRVEGHTDGLGSDAYNDELSLRRAEAVRLWLVRNSGFSPAGIRIEGYGKRRPIAPNQHPDGSDDPVGRQKNRRVEIIAAPSS